MVAALAAFFWQVYTGLGVSGLRSPVFWGFYITNFVFWIGLSHAGTLISAILRLANATWRRPVTRCAEVITVFALSIGAAFPVIHLGRPWLAFWLDSVSERTRHLAQHPVTAPLGFFRDQHLLAKQRHVFVAADDSGSGAGTRSRRWDWKKKIYSALALGWTGTPKQWHRLEKAMHIMAVAVIPVAVSVHSIVSWDFAMATVPMWHSTIFAPYFVAGAIFSGIAALIIAMALLRKFLHLEEYLLPIHFENLGKLLLVMSLLWFYFVFSERLTGWYGNESSEMAVFWLTQTRVVLLRLFWTMVFCNFLIPFPMLAIKKFRTITGTVIASATVVVGMWLERFLIIVPSLSHKYLPYSWGTYRPTWVEITITAGTFAAMALLYMLFSKVVPIISVWELKAGPREAAHPATALPQINEAGAD